MNEVTGEPVFGQAAPPHSVDPPSNPQTSSRGRRGLYTQAVYFALRERRAQLGIAWLGLVAVLAVFAPLLANSRPIVLKMGGTWSSPMLANLLWSDVSVFLSAVILIAIALFARRIPPLPRMLITGALLLTTGTISYLALSNRTDRINVYSTYREAAAAGQIEWALYAPIPYSPQDYLREQFQLDDPHPWYPRSGHRLGTDRNGGDIASRLIHACRIALSVGFIAEGVALLIGVTIGGLMGYFSGVVDLIGMRLVEIFSSIPQLYLLLAFVAFFQRDLYLIMLIIGLTSWTGYAVFTRAEFLRLRGQDFVQAAVASGLPTRRVIFVHLLPNGMAPILVSASFGVASAILAESTLSFLGVGLVGDPSWGNILNQAIGESRFYWWLAVFPGTAIFLTVLSYNFIGESLRDALDPKLLKRES